MLIKLSLLRYAGGTRALSKGLMQAGDQCNFAFMLLVYKWISTDIHKSRAVEQHVSNPNSGQQSAGHQDSGWPFACAISAMLISRLLDRCIPSAN
jgi:hypothetical protein